MFEELWDSFLCLQSSELANLELNCVYDLCCVELVGSLLGGS